jgi:hypothetical protein
MSEEMLKKLEQPDNPIFIVGIPAGTDPSATGDYVLHEVSAKHPGIVLAPTTGSAISFVAIEGKKEHFDLESVKLHIGLSPSIDFEWKKK